MRKLAAVARKEIRQIGRDPWTLAMLLGVPAFMLVVYGFALNFDVRHVPLAVQDRDLSAASRDLIAAFVNSTCFDVAAVLAPGGDPAALLESRAVKAVLVVPEGHAADLAAGRRAPVQILLDGTDALTATTVLGYASAIVAETNVALLAASVPGGGEAPILHEPRVWYNPELRSTAFLVPGLMGFILMLTGVLSTALSVVREKERGTMEQIRATALRPWQVIAGKALPYLGLSLAASAVIVAAARLLFGVSVRGSYADLFAVTLLYLIGALAFGLLVSSVAHTQAMAFQLGTVLSMLPAIFLSGFIFPIRSMPPVLQAITWAVPARYYLIVIRGIMLKGAGLAPYRDQIVFLVAFAAIVLAIAWARLAREEVEA